MVCPHHNTKTAETTTSKRTTGIVHHSRVLVQQLGQKVKGQDHRVTKCNNMLKAIEYSIIHYRVLNL